MSKTPIYEMTFPVSVRDIDAAGVVHFSCYTLWMEAVEHAFFRAKDILIIDQVIDGIYGWPRIQLKVDFKKILQFGDSVRVVLKSLSVGEKTLQYEYAFFKILSHSAVCVATGGMTTIYTYKPFNSHEPLYSLPIPEKIRTVLETGVNRLF